MLQIHISPVKVEEVVFLASDPDEEAADFYCWQAIRPLIDRISLLLATVAHDIASEQRTMNKSING